jgi:hypothetical protein
VDTVVLALLVAAEAVGLPAALARPSGETTTVEHAARSDRCGAKGRLVSG